jgi:hypothetical protein
MTQEAVRAVKRRTTPVSQVFKNYSLSVVLTLLFLVVTGPHRLEAVQFGTRAAWSDTGGLRRWWLHLAFPRRYLSELAVRVSAARGVRGFDSMACA